MADPLYPMFSVFAFIGFVITLIPLPWHLEAWNSGTCYYMLWTSIACLNQFINSVLWARTARNLAPVWCDISIRIMFGASVGIPAASLCIIRRLYNIASVQSVTVTKADKRRSILIDTLLCVGLPAVFIPLQYVVQGHRFNILEEIGCAPAIFNTLLLFFTTSIWPVILGLVSAVYCVLTLMALSKRRSQSREYFSSNFVTASRYFRLMALALTEVLFTTPLAIFGMYLSAADGGLRQWVSWADTHYNYGRVDLIPAVLWRSDRLALVALEMSRWSPVACALVFFAFFGFAEEARKNYRRLFLAIAGCCCGYTPPAPKHSQVSASASIGHYRRPKPLISTANTRSSKASLTPSSSSSASSDAPSSPIKRRDSLASSMLSGSLSPSSSLDEKNPGGLFEPFAFPLDGETEYEEDDKKGAMAKPLPLGQPRPRVDGQGQGALRVPVPVPVPLPLQADRHLQQAPPAFVPFRRTAALLVVEPTRRYTTV